MRIVVTQSPWVREIGPKVTRRMGWEGERDRSGGWFAPALRQRPSLKPEQRAQHAPVLGLLTPLPSHQHHEPGPHDLVRPGFVTTSVLPSEPRRATSQAALLEPRSRSNWRKGPAGDKDSEISKNEAVTPRGWATQGPNARQAWF